MSKKITISQAAELFKALGANVVVVADDAKADTDVDIEAITEEAETSIVEQHRPAIEQELNEKADKAAAARLGKMEAAKISQLFGIPKKELEGKPLDEMLAKAKETISTATSTEKEQYELQLKAFQEEKEAELNELRTQLEKSTKMYKDRDIYDNLSGVIGKVPRTGGDPTLQSKQFRAWLEHEKGLTLDVDDNKALSLKKDGKLALNEKNKPYDIEVLAREFSEGMGILAKDTSHVDPKDVDKDKKRTTVAADDNDPLAAIKGWAEA